MYANLSVLQPEDLELLCVFVCTFMYVCMHVEARDQCLISSSPLHFQTGSLAEPGAHWLAGLAGGSSGPPPVPALLRPEAQLLHCAGDRTSSPPAWAMVRFDTGSHTIAHTGCSLEAVSYLGFPNTGIIDTSHHTQLNSIKIFCSEEESGAGTISLLCSLL